VRGREGVTGITVTVRPSSTWNPAQQLRVGQEKQKDRLLSMVEKFVSQASRTLCLAILSLVIAHLSHVYEPLGFVALRQYRGTSGCSAGPHRLFLSLALSHSGVLRMDGCPGTKRFCKFAGLPRTGATQPGVSIVELASVQVRHAHGCVLPTFARNFHSLMSVSVLRKPKVQETRVEMMGSASIVISPSGTSGRPNGSVAHLGSCDKEINVY